VSLALRERTLAWDWYPGTIPENVEMEEQAYLETSYSFYLFRSRAPRGLCIGRAATVYQGTMFDVGVRGRVHIGQYALVHGAWIVCDAEIEIGDHALISWNVVLMDSYRLPFDPPARRKILEQVAKQVERRPTACVAAKPIRIERNVWLGFEVCVLPGVTIGEGSIVGARSVVVESVPPYTMVCGNPARVIRRIPNDEIKEGPLSVHDQ
jgi:acetyltransferase-like isoleucine patch superfamily enzyme